MRRAQTDFECGQDKFEQLREARRERFEEARDAGLSMRGIAEETSGAGADAPSVEFALQFARAYPSYDAARPELREAALGPFLSEHLIPPS